MRTQTTWKTAHVIEILVSESSVFVGADQWSHPMLEWITRWIQTRWFCSSIEANSKCKYNFMFSDPLVWFWLTNGQPKSHQWIRKHKQCDQKRSSCWLIFLCRVSRQERKNLKKKFKINWFIWTSFKNFNSKWNTWKTHSLNSSSTRRSTHSKVFRTCRKSTYLERFLIFRFVTQFSAKKQDRMAQKLAVTNYIAEMTKNMMQNELWKGASAEEVLSTVRLLERGIMAVLFDRCDTIEFVFTRNWFLWPLVTKINFLWIKIQ